MSTREQNEQKFSNWEILPPGGRRYWLDVLGGQGWKARYVKEVDADTGKLVEIHHKYPVDHGHQKVTS